MSNERTELVMVHFVCGVACFHARIDRLTTGQQAVQGLQRERFLDSRRASRRFILRHPQSGRRLRLRKALVEQGVTPGDTILVSLDE